MPSIDIAVLKRITDKAQAAKFAVSDAGRDVGHLRNRVPRNEEAVKRAEARIPGLQAEYMHAVCQAIDELHSLIVKTEREARVAAEG